MNCNRLYTYLLISFLSFSLAANGQKKNENWSKVRITLDRNHTLQTLGRLGVETDHGDLKPGKSFTSAFSSTELVRIRKAGFETEVLVKDVIEDFQLRNQAVGPVKIQEDFFADFCNKVKTYKSPKHWRLGTMGGHLKYEEMLAHLDSMRILYPNLISARAAIDTTKTIQGRTIWSVRLSDNPNVSEPSEPQALYTAVHHAREPVGMHQLIFYMWYLLENYQTNSEIKALVNNSELYFVPCVNPDGYIYNQTEFPEGGGMWRKNRRDNNDGSFGTDLNRNYGYNWGYDDFGSSPDPQMDTYRGSSGFSEPETRAIKAFCESHSFKIALNYHTYSNLIIHPWGYENLQCDDSLLYWNLTREMSKENNYRIGTGMMVLNYNSNGSSDDFMYSTNAQKPKILAMTPEVGDWFWPTQDEIQGLCFENVHQNLTVLRALHPMVEIRDSTGLFHYPGLSSSPGTPRIRYKINRIGASTANANFTVTFTPFGANSAGIPTLTKTYNNMVPNQVLLDSIQILTGSSAIEQSAKINWEMTVNNGIFVTRDTVFHYGGYRDIPSSLKENCDNINRWSGSWLVLNSGQNEGTGFLKPTEGTYSPLMDETMTRIAPFDLRSPQIKSAQMSFWTRFEIEKNYDFASLAFSIDSGQNWTNVCTDKSVLSSPFSQQAGENTIIPIWDGNQTTWRKEYINLQDYLGQKLWIRFRFLSDPFSEFDGFGVDDIQITTNQLLTGTNPSELVKEDVVIFPNPGSGKSKVLFSSGSTNQTAEIAIFSAVGNKVYSGSLNAGYNQMESFNPEAGCYFVVVTTPSGKKIQKTWLVKN